MNEALSRALLRARLTDEDVAAHLQVDPKTVRRWLEGRVPYLRHRWAIALLVDMDESDLWPRLASAGSGSAEVVSVFGRRDLVPMETWQRLFGSANHVVGVLADSEFLLTDGGALLGLLARRARASVLARVCLTGMDASNAPDGECGHDADRRQAASIRDAVKPAEFRVSPVRGYNSICHADEHLLVSQHVYGLPAGQAPVLHLRGRADAGLMKTYLASFEDIWSSAGFAK